MKRVIQGLEKENSTSFLLASLSSTPARDLGNASPWATEHRAITQHSVRVHQLILLVEVVAGSYGEGMGLFFCILIHKLAQEICFPLGCTHIIFLIYHSLD